MSQADIMDYLDKHPGKFYNAKEIRKGLNNKVSIFTVTRSLKKILKREEYTAKIAENKKGVLQTFYGKAYSRRNE